MTNLIYYPYPKNFNKDIQTIAEYCNVSIDDAIQIYGNIRKKYGDLEWFSFNSSQKISRIIDYRDNFLSF